MGRIDRMKLEIDRLALQKAGHVYQFPVCDCGAVGTKDETFDSYKCDRCSKWLEPVCDEAGCEFCNKRPDVPNL